LLRHIKWVFFCYVTLIGCYVTLTRQGVIKVIGYEKNAEAAKQEILNIVHDLDSHISQDIHIDRRVHPRLIGAKGRAIRKIMDDFGVDIRFPKDEDIVTVTGVQEKVEECVEHILNLEEEFVSGGFARLWKS